MLIQIQRQVQMPILQMVRARSGRGADSPGYLQYRDQGRSGAKCHQRPVPV